MQWYGGPIALGGVSLTYLSIDIDIDSDNNNHLEPPLRSLEEEHTEETSPKKVVVNSTNRDRNNIPDYADWWVGGTSFTPVVVQIPDAIPVAEMAVTFGYVASDPDEVSVVPPYDLPENSGPIRLWAKNASDVRSPLSVPQRLLPSGARGSGDFVKPGVVYDASALGFSQAARAIVFYVEGVRLSKDPNPIRMASTALRSRRPLSTRQTGVSKKPAATPSLPSTASRTAAISSKPRVEAFGSGTPADGSGERPARPEPSSLEQPAIPE